MSADTRSGAERFPDDRSKANLYDAAKLLMDEAEAGTLACLQACGVTAAGKQILAIAGMVTAADHTAGLAALTEALGEMIERHNARTKGVRRGN